MSTERVLSGTEYNTFRLLRYSIADAFDCTVYLIMATLSMTHWWFAPKSPNYINDLHNTRWPLKRPVITRFVVRTRFSCTVYQYLYPTLNYGISPNDVLVESYPKFDTQGKSTFQQICELWLSINRISMTNRALTQFPLHRIPDRYNFGSFCLCIDWFVFKLCSCYVSSSLFVSNYVRNIAKLLILRWSHLSV